MLTLGKEGPSEFAQLQGHPEAVLRCLPSGLWSFSEGWNVSVAECLVRTSQCTHGGQRTPYKSLFSPSIAFVLPSAGSSHRAWVNETPGTDNAEELRCLPSPDMA